LRRHQDRSRVRYVFGGGRERQRLRPGGAADGDGNDEGWKNGTLHRRTLTLNSSDELHYKRKATPNGKQKLPRAVLARPRARFVALKFILRKRRSVMVNGGF
jgi:hypothetical protein